MSNSKLYQMTAQKKNDGYDGIRGFLSELGERAQQAKNQNPKLSKTDAIIAGMRKMDGGKHLKQRPAHLKVLKGGKK